MKEYFKIGPRGGLVSVGIVENNQDLITALGRKPEEGEKFVFGTGRNQKIRRECAEDDLIFNLSRK